MLTTRIRTFLALTVFAAFAFTATASFAEDAKIPQTAADHQALAKAYQDKAAGYTKDAEWHKQMAEQYGKNFPDVKAGVKNPWNVKMQKHCLALQKDAQKLAADNEKAAEYHMLRAQELSAK
jgi:uncharacterized protein YifE (UPF0438 family)